ncbi:MgtC/SapB family protein [Candidatus Woesearchaeota archaeon]|nr:MgtC/SapB family protein [Candidatus Woesearchaeota archaeon]
MELIYEQVLKLLLAVVLSGLIGWERERSHKPAGLRTHMLVCLGSTLISMISVGYFIEDYARIIASVITGIGFIGAGTIIAQGSKGVHGLTTAASLWLVAAIGICIGVGWHLLAIVSSLLIVLILFLGSWGHSRLSSRK